MAFCTRCGSAFDDSNSVCPQCGFNTAAAVPPAVQSEPPQAPAGQTLDQTVSLPQYQAGPQVPYQAAPQVPYQGAPQAPNQPAPLPQYQAASLSQYQAAAAQSVNRPAVKKKSGGKTCLVVALVFFGLILLLVFGIILFVFILPALALSGSVDDSTDYFDDLINGSGYSDSATPGNAGAHSDINNSGPSGICQIGDWIYYVDDEQSLARMRPDGSRRSTIEDLSYFYSLQVFDDILYFNCMDYDNDDSYDQLGRYDPSDDSMELLVSVCSGNSTSTLDTYIISYYAEDDVAYYIVEITAYSDLETFEMTDYNEIRCVDDSGDTLLCTLPDNYYVSWKSSLAFNDNKLYFIADDEYTGDCYLMTYDLRNNSLSRHFSWEGSYNDTFIFHDGKAFVSSPYEGMFCCNPSGTGKNFINRFDDIDAMYVCGDYVIYSTSVDYVVDSETSFMQGTGIYRYNINTGESEQIFYDYCDLLGVADGWIYFYDESALSTCTDYDDYYWHESLSRIRFDGSGLSELL